MSDKEYPHVGTTGSRYRIIHDEDGTELWEYETGVIRNPATRVLVKPYFTKDIASDMGKKGVIRKQELAVERARAGLVRGVGAREIVNDWGIAWEYVVAAQAELAMTPDMGNASTRAAEFIAKVADLNPKRESLEISDGQKSVSFKGISPEKMDYILEKLNGRKDGE